MAMISQFHYLLENGIATKYPGIRWAFIEAAASWLPYALQDAESRLSRKGKKRINNPLKDNNIWITLVMAENIPYLIDRVGDDNFLIGTDYGHTDTSAKTEAFRMLGENRKIAENSVDKILGPNQKIYTKYRDNNFFGQNFFLDPLPLNFEHVFVLGVQTDENCRIWG